MSRNDITGDNIASRTTTDAYREGHDRIFGKKSAETYACVYCGAPSFVHPCDQTPPADYCDHHTEDELK